MHREIQKVARVPIMYHKDKEFFLTSFGLFFAGATPGKREKKKKGDKEKNGTKKVVTTKCG